MESATASEKGPRRDNNGYGDAVKESLEFGYCSIAWTSKNVAFISGLGEKGALNAVFELEGISFSAVFKSWNSGKSRRFDPLIRKTSY